MTNNKLYVGSAVELHSRFKSHKSLLQRNKHPNRHLQYSWNKYGEKQFIFKTLERVSNRNKLLEKEQWWIEETRCCVSKFGYNINPYAESRLGTKVSNKTKLKLKKIDKWPCADGSRCKCSSCKETRNKSIRKNYHQKRWLLLVNGYK